MALPDDVAKRVQNEAEDYSSTVHSLLAFSAFVVHDKEIRRPDSHFGFGRRMNNAATGAEVTPDVSAQRDSSYGLIAEMKKSLPADREKWLKVIEQLKKYDASFRGWWTQDETIGNADTILLVHHSRSRAFVEVLKKYLADHEDLSDRVSVVEFLRSDERTVYHAFRLEFGTIHDETLAGRLNESVHVPLQKVLQSFPNIKYYDAPPPLPKLLVDLWQDTLAVKAADAPYDERTKSRLIEVDVEAITSELQRAYGSQALEVDQRSVEFPKFATVKAAFETLVRIKLALPASGNLYRVMYRQFGKKNDDLLLKFAEMIGVVAQQPSEEQQSLFPAKTDLRLSVKKTRKSVKAQSRNGSRDEHSE